PAGRVPRPGCGSPQEQFAGCGAVPCSTQPAPPPPRPRARSAARLGASASLAPLYKGALGPRRRAPPDRAPKPDSQLPQHSESGTIPPGNWHSPPDATPLHRSIAPRPRRRSAAVPAFPRRRSCNHLLEPFHRMVKVDPRGSRGGSQRRSDLRVLDALLGSKQEHLPLQPGEGLQGGHEPALRFPQGEGGFGIVPGGEIMVLQRYRTPDLSAPVFVFEQVARDGKDPASKSGDQKS